MVVDVLLNHRGKPIGCVMAKYLSMAIAVIVKTLAPTATPEILKIKSKRDEVFSIYIQLYFNYFFIRYLTSNAIHY